MHEQPQRPTSLGADHAELEGSHDAFRYRPERLRADALAFKPVCSFRFHNRTMVAREVLDLSQNGVAIVPSEKTPLTPGTVLEDVRIVHQNNRIWRGEAVVVYGANGSNRVGLRFTQGRLNLNSLRYRDDFVEQRLVQALYQVHNDVADLPVEWRAGIAHVRKLLEAAKQTMDDMETSEASEAWRRSPRRKRELCQMVHEKWWPFYRDQLRAMAALSRTLPPNKQEVAQRYAARELMPLLRDCPMHSRAYDKPNGYAGDFELMLLGNAEELSGESLYGCLLQHTVQNYDLGRAIVERCHTARAAVTAQLRADRPTRILSLAAGPALELQEFLREQPRLLQPVELILLDVDEDAIRYAHNELENLRQARPEDGHLITIKGINFSVSQLMRPANPDERRLIEQELQDVDLIYSMGLFDYLAAGFASLLLRRLYGLLGDGGRLFIGNLRRAEDCSWAMDYAVHWQLIYREREDMLELARRMRQHEASTDVTSDATGYCLFLDVRKPAAG